VAAALKPDGADVRIGIADGVFVARLAARRSVVAPRRIGRIRRALPVSGSTMTSLRACSSARVAHTGDVAAGA
jgi:hypothetical protein